MNKSNQLLALLDRVFGFPNKIRSTFRKLSQNFDEKTNEHVILIEYGVSVKGTMKSKPRQKQGPNPCSKKIHPCFDINILPSIVCVTMPLNFASNEA